MQIAYINAQFFTYFAPQAVLDPLTGINKATRHIQHTLPRITPSDA
jgi:primase-polymerase (primpol)-like protein